MDRFSRRRARRQHGQRVGQRHRRLNLESLESRRVLTTTVFVDFGADFTDGALQTTPAALRDIAGANTGPQLVADFNGDGTPDFALNDTLTLRSFDSLVFGPGSANIDFNGSGTADAADATELRAAILARIAEQFAPFDVVVVEASATTLADVQSSLAANAGNAGGQFDAYLFVTSITRDAVSVGSIVGAPGLIATGDRDAGSNQVDELGIIFAEQLVAAAVQPAQLNHLFANVASNLAGQSFGVSPTNRGVDATGAPLPEPTATNYALLNANNVMVEFGGGTAALSQPKLFSRFDLVRGGGNVDPVNVVNPFEELVADADIGPNAGAGSFVFGTGAFDRIEITPGAAGLANVVVEAYSSDAFDTLIDSVSYSVALAGGIAIEAGPSDDLVEIGGDVVAAIDLRGGPGNDELYVAGTGAQVGSYLPLAGDPGAGTVTVVGGPAITFSELTPVTVLGFANFTFTTPSSADVINIDSPSAGLNRISGTSDGIAFESLSFFEVTNLTINLSTNDAASPDDRLIIDEAGLVAAGLASLTVIGGDGKDVFVVRSSATATINIQGGDPAAGDAGVPPGDTLVVADLSPSPYPTVFPDGTINIAGQQPINYTGIEPIAVADAFEPNDTIATATELGNAATVTQADLSIFDAGDIDYFRYVAPLTGKLYVTIEFDADIGDLDLRIHDNLDRTLAGSISTLGTEFVVIPVVANQEYFFRINGDAGSINNYTLNVENFAAPTPTQVSLATVSGSGNITNDTTPTLLVAVDLMSFVDINGDGIYQPTPGLPSDGIEPIVLTAAQAAAGTTPGFAVEVQITNVDSGITQTLFADAVDPTNPVLFTVTPPSKLELGDYVITAAVRTFDASVTPLTDLSDLSPPFDLEIVFIRPQLAAYFGNTVVVDTNGNGKYDPGGFFNPDGDRSLAFGNTNDQRFAGAFSFGINHVLVAHGRVNNQFRFVFDTNANGQIDPGDQVVVPTLQINGLAVAGDFDPATPGDEIAVFDGTRWYLDTNGNRDLDSGDTTITGNMRGYPVAGDFDGDGVFDIGTWQNNTFFLDLNRDGTADITINHGAPGKLDRPVVADMDGDGIADLGLWVPQSGAVNGDAEWRFLLSNGTPWTTGIDLLPRPTATAQFGNAQALPLLGAFGPPGSEIPVVFIGNPVSQDEGDTGTTPYVFPVTLSANPTNPITVVVTTSDGTATAADNDYQPLTQTLTFLPGGALTQNVTVLGNGDTTMEPDEAFNVTLSSLVGVATITKATTTGTLVNDDLPPGMTITSVQQLEGNTGTTPFEFTVTLSETSQLPVTVVFATANDTALAPSDYAASSGTLTIAPGSLSGTILINVVGDTVPEPNETFFINLSNPVNALFAGGAATLQTIGTILNDDLSLSIGAPTPQNEGNAGTTPFVFPVTLAADPNTTVTVVVATSDGTATTADNDYTPLSQTLTFLPGGALTQNVTVQVVGDTTDENNETFNVTLSDAVGTVIGTASAVGTIVNDDAPPVLSIADVSLPEGALGDNTTFAFPVTLSQASGKQITVAFATAAGGSANQATPGTDFTSVNGTLTIAAGATSGIINVTVIGDDDIEPDETFVLNLSSAVNTTFIGGNPTLQAIGTIVDDDTAPETDVLPLPIAAFAQTTPAEPTPSAVITPEEPAPAAVTPPVAQSQVAVLSSSELASPITTTPTVGPIAPAPTTAAALQKFKTKTLVLTPSITTPTPPTAKPVVPVPTPQNVEAATKVIPVTTTVPPKAVIQPAVADQIFAQLGSTTATTQSTTTPKKKVLVLAR
jgi:hypothetical protein